MSCSLLAVKLYNDIVHGASIVESSLLHKTIEHINAEIALGNVVRVAVFASIICNCRKHLLVPYYTLARSSAGHLLDEIYVFVYPDEKQSSVLPTDS